MAERWNPWRALRSRPNTTFARAHLPPSAGEAVCAVWSDGDAVIVIDTSLGRQHRNVALAHELVHLERGGGCGSPNAPASWAPVVVREETIVQREVARRLIPPDELAAFVERRLASDLETTPHEVAEEFDTTWQLAELSMLLMKGAT